MEKDKKYSGISLGEDALYPDKYDAGLLAPIARTETREALWGSAPMPCTGVDVWTAYELSWLDTSGKPRVAMAEFTFDAGSSHIVESKSFKYYLNSLNQTVFSSRNEVHDVMQKDLTAASGGDVSIRFLDVNDCSVMTSISGFCVDELDVTIEHYTPDAAILRLKKDKKKVRDARLYSHVLKSNCPVTGQPDWATVWIEYSGAEICPASFLKYVVSYRQHQDFHENCVERMFRDIDQQCQPESLSVYARYTRRGGLDINPFRTNTGRALPFGRLARQ